MDNEKVLDEIESRFMKQAVSDTTIVMPTADVSRLILMAWRLMAENTILQARLDKVNNREDTFRLHRIKGEDWHYAVGSVDCRGVET